VRKTGETPCGRGGQRSQGRVFAVAVVFAVVFGGAGYELAGSGSLLHPRPSRRHATVAASWSETAAASRNLLIEDPTRKSMPARRAKSRLTVG
jgi:hypothetical protein